MSILVHNEIINLAREVKQFFEAYFQGTPVAYFEHARVFHSGKAFRVCSPPEVTEYFLCKNFALPDPSIYPSPGIFIWSSTPGLNSFDDQIFDLKTKFNFGNGLCFTRPTPSYLEMFDFASKLNRVESINFCINNVGMINNFCDKYVSHFDSVFKNLERLLIDVPLRPKNFPNHQQGIDVFSKITIRERDCLSLLADGNTAKMSARILGISERTVERHLENVKVKLDVRYKAELLAKFLDWKGSGKEVQSR